MTRIPFSKDILKIKDIEALSDYLGNMLKEQIFVKHKRRGAVIGISGGIDSSVSMALAAKYLGPEKVFGIMMPEKDSSPDSESMAEKLAKKFGVPHVLENIRPALEGLKCYERRDEAIKKVFPDFNPFTDKSKIGINKTGLSQKLPPLFYLTVIDKEGTQQSKIIPVKEYMQIVAASNFKQRCRMAMTYYYAEKMHYMVIGSANKHEIDQGFFVKFGDGGADIYPQANLYKTQVYQLAEYLGVTREIIERVPTTDTYSAEQTQEEFFYQLPFALMDPLWYGYENGYGAAEVGEVMDIPTDEVEIIFSNFDRKRKTTEYLRTNPYHFPSM